MAQKGIYPEFDTCKWAKPITRPGENIRDNSDGVGRRPGISQARAGSGPGMGRGNQRGGAAGARPGAADAALVRSAAATSENALLRARCQLPIGSIPAAAQAR